MPELRSVSATRRRLYGKYRGNVVNNIDPKNMGRILVSVPDVSPSVSTWAMPCVPVAGTLMGAFAVPPIGAGVWVEYEQGDQDHPIWVGCWWGASSELPGLSSSVRPPFQGLVFQTAKQNAFMVSDMPGPLGGILLKTSTGALIAINDIEMKLDNGRGASIALRGPTVFINGTALTVT